MKALAEIFLRPRQALILAGPQGCGKSTLAREIAATFGAFYECSFETIIYDRFAIGRILAHEPKALIIDGLPDYGARMPMLMALIKQETILCDVRLMLPASRKCPQAVIFCAQTHETERARTFAREYPSHFQLVELD